jgi:hypothetical protein
MPSCEGAGATKAVEQAPLVMYSVSGVDVMRTGRFFRLLAGTAMAATVIAPSPGIAAPDRIQSAPPPPPLINGQRIIRSLASSTGRSR